jgi:hypothetical protein
LNQNWRFFQIKNLIKEIWIGVTVVLFENWEPAKTGFRV